MEASGRAYTWPSGRRTGSLTRLSGSDPGLEVKIAIHDTPISVDILTITLNDMHLPLSCDFATRRRSPSRACEYGKMTMHLVQVALTRLPSCPSFTPIPKHQFIYLEH